MQIGNPETGDFRGYEVELLEELGRKAGVGLVFRRALWSVIVDELAAGEVDVVCSAATITSDRTREVDFCSPHLHLTLAVAKRAGIDSDTAIDGLRLGVRRGTTAESYLRGNSRDEPALISESNEELYAALAAGELDAVVDDSPIAKFFTGAVAGLQFAGALPKTDSAYAIVLRKGNDELRMEINRVLAEMERDGVRRALLHKWFGETGER
ncbi:MAG TPA: ABC transporter substrate-binding protein [Candidatus Babeliales bacterium]|nr:ABC transporter substrate-binding protein [Candidatus Babeliales bacterium]